MKGEIPKGGPKPKWSTTWVEVAPGRKRLVVDGQGLSPTRRKKERHGRKDETYEEERYRLLYREKMVVCEDLKDKRARNVWPRYKILPDGREGPLPFKDKHERKLYCKTFGFRESADWS